MRLFASLSERTRGGVCGDDDRGISVQIAKRRCPAVDWQVVTRAMDWYVPRSVITVAVVAYRWRMPVRLLSVSVCGLRAGYHGVVRTW